jgi:hypothetical protein
MLMIIAILSANEARGIVPYRYFLVKLRARIFQRRDVQLIPHLLSTIMTTHIFEINTSNPILSTLPSSIQFYPHYTTSSSPHLLRLLTLLTNHKPLALGRPHDSPPTIFTRLLGSNLNISLLILLALVILNFRARLLVRWCRKAVRLSPMPNVHCGETRS